LDQYEEKTMARATRDEIIALERAYWDAIMAKDGDRTSELAGETSLTTGRARCAGDSEIHDGQHD
jgi:hypothetical protein